LSLYPGKTPAKNSRRIPMSGQESAPAGPGQDPTATDPAAANQASQTLNPEQLAARAEERMEDVYDIVVTGGIVRNTLDFGHDPARPDDELTPALYMDRIGIATAPETSGIGLNAPVTGVHANRPDTVPSPFKSRKQPLDRADASLDFSPDGRYMSRPSRGREGRAKVPRFVRLVTRNEQGEPIYEDEAFHLKDGLRGYAVRRKTLEGAGDTQYDQEPHTDVEEFTRIVTEATDIVLAAAKARAEQEQAKHIVTQASIVVEAAGALANLN
jgi:hypothetical protein